VLYLYTFLPFLQRIKQECISHRTVKTCWILSFYPRCAFKDTRPIRRLAVNFTPGLALKQNDYGLRDAAENGTRLETILYRFDQQ